MGWDSGSQAWGGAAPSGGGGGGGGGSVSPILDWQLIDTTAMTKTTPDAMQVSSEALSSGTGMVTYTFAALGSGDADAKYNLSGSGAEYPRYSSSLVDSAGVQLTTDDSFVMFVRLSEFDTTVPSSADLRIAVGLCLSPTATTTGAFDGYGIGMRSRAASRVGATFKADTTSAGFSSYSSTATDTIFGSIQRTTRRLGALITFGEDSDGGTISPSTGRTTAVVSNTALSAGSNYSLFVAIGTNSNSGTIAAGQTLGFRADYAIKRLR